MQTNNRILHIICPEMPYPLIHGGRFDLFYKIVALSGAGIGVHLHCFGQETAAQKELNRYCLSIHYYPRITGLKGLSLPLPYIVSSRRSRKLLSNLMADNHPILFEGVHSTGIVTQQDIRQRKLILRLHNAEFVYYRKLYEASRNPAKKIYYLTESILLERYEKNIVSKIPVIVPVSSTDAGIYRDQFGASNVQQLPVFIEFPNSAVAEAADYCLYHGNLSVPENEAAVIFLLREVFSGFPVPLIIAGRNPGRSLKKLLSGYPLATLIENPSASHLESLIVKARVNVIPSMNATGVKLKLIHALFSGGHCVTNTAGAAGSGLDNFCSIADEPDELAKVVKDCYQAPLTVQQMLERKAALEKIFDAEKNINRLIQLIW